MFLLLNSKAAQSSGVSGGPPRAPANRVPPASTKLSHRINFKSLEENEGRYRHRILFAPYSKLKAIDRKLCFALFRARRRAGVGIGGGGCILMAGPPLMAGHGATL